MKQTKLTTSKTMLVTALAGSFVLAGCAEDMNSELRVIHASPDAPAVNVNVKGRINNLTISELDYATSSGYEDVAPGRRTITVDAITPEGELEVIKVKNFQFKADERYNVLAVGDTADIEPLVVAENEADPADNEVSLTIVHASPDAPEVDVYVVGPGTDISPMGVMPTFTFDFKDDAVTPPPVPAGSYDIYVTLAGTKTVAYDILDVSLAPFAGQKVLLAAVSTTTATTKEASPIKLLAATDDAQLTLLDKDTQAGARVVHLSPDADVAATGPVEVVANSADLGVSGLELIDAFSYTQVAPPDGGIGLPLSMDGSYIQVPPADDFIFNVNIDNGGNVFNSGEVALAAGSEATVIAAGLVTRTPALVCCCQAMRIAQSLPRPLLR